MAVTLESSTALAPLCMAWLGKVQEGVRGKKMFNDVADQCMGFYRGSVGFMWENDFMRKYIGTMMAPTFKITVAKAFELVALFGPTLYWRNPQRMVKPRKTLQLDPGLFMGMDPSGILAQQMAMQQQQESVVDKAVAGVLELYLNYTPQEQPGGGLATHASAAITEALVKGRGCCWPRPYFMPGSERVMTGCFYDSVDNLIIDPDATSLETAKWIAQRCVQPVWEVERTFGLPDGTLKGKGNYESADSQGSRDTQPWSAVDRQAGKTFDLITYYKVYSKGGVGFRLGGQQKLDDELGTAMDQAIGDYAYIVVAPGVPYPLNAPTQFLSQMTDAEVARRFAWPAEFWRDDKWPVSVLDFYRAPNSSWPIAPLAPGLGELAMINILTSRLANHIWWNTRAIVGMNGSIPEGTEQKLKSGNDIVTYHFKNANESPEKAMVFAKIPEINQDMYKGLEYYSANFDKRTGLSDLLYGMNPGGVQSRTAEDVATKREMVSIRPDYMAGKVEDWMGELADMERIAAATFVKGQDLDGLYGVAERFVWERFIQSDTPEIIARGMRATVAANSMRKPDKQRDVQNVNQLLPIAMPIMQGYWQMTGDPRGINSLIGLWGKTMDQEVGDIMLPPTAPPEQEGQDQNAALAQQAEEIQRQQLEEAHSQQLRHTENLHRQKLTHQHQEAQHKAGANALMSTIQLKAAKAKAQQAAKPKPKPKRQGAAA